MNQNTDILPDIRSRFNIEHPTLEDCWADGYECAENDLEEHDNPYAKTSNEHEHWAEGWWAGFYNEEKIYTQKILNQKILKVSKLTVARGGTKNKPLRGFRGGVFKGEYAKYNKEDDKETPNSQTKIDGVQMIH